MKPIRALQLEWLEPRVLLSVNSEFLAGALTVTTDADDAIIISTLDGNVLVNGDNPGGGPDPVAAADVASLLISADGDFANTIDVSGVGPEEFTSLAGVSIDAGAGGDEVFGSALPDTVTGGPGDDALWGGAGDDYLDGGDGTDTVAGGAGTDTELGEVFPDADFTDLAGDLYAFLEGLQDAVNASVFLRPIPLIGDQLAGPDYSLSAMQLDDPSVIAQFIAGADGFAGALESALLDAGLDAASAAADVQQALFDALKPTATGDAAGLLGDTNDDADINEDDIIYWTAGDGDVFFSALLSRAITENVQENDAAFVLGTTADYGANGPQDPVQWQLLEWLNSGKDMDVDVSLGFDYLMTFAVSEVGFYESTSVTDELFVEVSAAIPDLQDRDYFRIGLLEARLSDFPAGLSDPDAGPSYFDGTYTIDLLPDGQVAAVLNGEAEANFLVDARFFQGDSDINLRVVSHLHLGGPVGTPGDVSTQGPWTFTDADPADYTTPFGDEPVILFDEVQLDLDSFFGGFAGDIISRVQSVTKPLQPLVDVLNTNLPVISDLGGPATLAELIGGETAQDFVDAIDALNSIHVPESGPLEGAFVDMGWFVLSDPREPNPVIADYSGNPDALEDSQTLYEQVFDPEVIISMGKGPFYASVTPSDEDGIHLPLFEEPLETFGLFVNRHASLFLYDFPVMEAGIGYEEFIPLFGPIGTTIGGHISVGADLKFGYDTYGLARYRTSYNWLDILDGFYVWDQEIGSDGLPTGPDPREFWVEMELGATMEVNISFIVTVRAGVWGGVFGDVSFNIADVPDPITGRVDGRVRPSELDLNAGRGIECIFDVEGALWGGLDAFVWVGINVDFGLFEIEIKLWEWREHLVKETLLDFSFSCPEATSWPPLGTYDSATGVLTLNTDVGDPFADADILFVRPFEDPEQGEGVQVAGRGGVEEFFDVSLIEADGGAGDDIIVVLPGVTADAVLHGGEGNDQLLYLGEGRADIYGDAGNDQLRGRSMDDVLDGGEGDDVLIGGGGADTLLGGAGDDELRGGSDDDYLDGGEGDDILDGEKGDDEMYGGPGADEFAWKLGDGSDTLSGGPDGLDEEDNPVPDELNVTFSGAANTAQMASTGTGALLTIDGAELLTFSGIEHVSLLLGGGADAVTLYDLAGSGIQEVGIDAGYIGGADGVTDTILLHGTSGADICSVPLSQDMEDEGTQQATDPDETLGDAGDVNVEIDPEAGDPDLMIAVHGLPALVTISGTTAAADYLTINGTGGDDTFQVMEGVDDLVYVSIIGSGGSDTVIGLDVPNVWHIASDNVGTLTGVGVINLFSVENLQGGADSDLFIFSDGTGVDGYINGGDGEDTLDYSAYTTDVQVNLAAGTATGVGAAVSEVEHVLAGSGDDTITGGEGDNVLSGGPGDDVLTGLGGDDVLDGGPGDDVMDGGEGDDLYIEVPGSDDAIFDSGGIDRIDLSGAAMAVRLDLRKDRGQKQHVDDAHNSLTITGVIEEAVGTPFSDTIDGNRADNVLIGLGGDDWLRGWQGDDLLEGGPGDDWLFGDQDNDEIHGGEGDDFLLGLHGDDWLYGGAGNDRLLGAAGQDFFDGGDGEDTILGKGTFSLAAFTKQLR